MYFIEGCYKAGLRRWLYLMRRSQQATPCSWWHSVVQTVVIPSGLDFEAIGSSTVRYYVGKLERVVPHPLCWTCKMLSPWVLFCETTVSKIAISPTKAIKLQNCVAKMLSIQGCAPSINLLCELLVYTRLRHEPHKATYKYCKITYSICACFLIFQVVALHLLLLLHHHHLPHQHSMHWLVVINNCKTLLSAECGSVVNYHFLWIINYQSIMHRTNSLAVSFHNP